MAGERASPAKPELHPSGARSSKFAALFVPDLALIVALVAIGYMVLIAGGPSLLFRDSDAGWHIRSGERIIANHALPLTDPFSFSKAGQPWLAWEWIADVIAGELHMAAGLTGVALFYVLAIGASVWMWFRLNWAAGGNFLLASAFAAPMLSTTNLHWFARPHVISWLFLLGAMWLCESKAVRAVSPVVLAGVFFLTALWANIHGSFILAPVIFVIYAAGSVLKPLIWGDEPQASWRLYLSFAIAALLGSLANPHGWNLHRQIVGYLMNSALLDRVAEFQSLNFHTDGAGQIMLGLMIELAGGFAALAARRPERFLLTLVLTAGALRSARMLPVAALLLLPIANGSICDALRQAQLAPRCRKFVNGILDYGTSLGKLDRKLGGLALVPFIAMALFVVVHAMRPAFPADRFPVGASASIAALPADAKLFSTDEFGGYMIYRFNGQRKVYFDGRSDFYGADFLKTYSRMVQAHPGWQAEFARGGFTYALLPPDYPLVSALEFAGWKETYRDKTAVLLKGPQS